MKGPLYHITFFANLPSIARRGLVAEYGGTAMGSRASHSGGAVFLTGGDGLDIWYQLAIDTAHDEMVLEEDDPGDPLQWTPVVLSVPSGEGCVQDEVALEEEGLEDAYRCAQDIPPANLQVFDGTRWLPISAYTELDPSSAWTRGPELKSKMPLMPGDGDEPAASPNPPRYHELKRRLML